MYIGRQVRIDMKRLFIIVSSVILCHSVFGQGQVMFNNLDLTARPYIDARIYDWKFGGYASYDGYVRAALLGGPVGSKPVKLDSWYYEYDSGNLSELANPVNGQTWVNFLSGTNAGYVDVGNSGARVVPNVGYGQPVMLQMVAWTGSTTNCWEGFFLAIDFYQTEFGCSDPWIVTTTQSATDTNYARNVGLKPFSIYTFPIPEPWIGPVPLAVSRAGTNVIFKWPINGMSLTLQCATALGSSAVWTNVAQGHLVNKHNELILPLARTNRFFRLVK
jgi:hypothetical protein